MTRSLPLAPLQPPAAQPRRVPAGGGRRARPPPRPPPAAGDPARSHARPAPTRVPPPARAEPSSAPPAPPPACRGEEKAGGAGGDLLLAALGLTVREACGAPEQRSSWKRTQAGQSRPWGNGCVAAKRLASVNVLIENAFGVLLLRSPTPNLV